MGKEASNPIWKLLAPINTAIETRKVPPVKLTITSPARLSFTIYRSPLWVCSSVSFGVGDKNFMSPSFQADERFLCFRGFLRPGINDVTIFFKFYPGPG